MKSVFFFDILESNVFEGILREQREFWVSQFCHSIIQKIRRTDRKQYIFSFFGGGGGGLLKICIVIEIY